MRFMIIRKADADTEAGVMPSEALIRAMAAYVEEMVEAGVMRSGDGLRPSREGARVEFRDGTPRVIDGPFAEAKELVAGVSVIDVPSKEEAIRWLLRWPREDGDGNVTLELRPMYEVDDLGAGEGIEHHKRLQARMAEG